jgi:hypothetical protein
MSISTYSPRPVASAKAFSMSDSDTTAMLSFCDGAGIELVSIHNLPQAVADEVAETFNHAMAEAEVEREQMQTAAAFQTALPGRAAE